jgi:archaellum biogenesis protein FlaJ (TadC family)
LSNNLEVGGKAEIGGEVVSQNIEIGGVLRSKRAQAQNSIEVGGVIDTTEGSTALALLKSGKEAKFMERSRQTKLSSAKMRMQRTSMGNAFF